jgi:membrane protease YdiL (CAAX protease family)
VTAGVPSSPAMPAPPDHPTGSAGSRRALLVSCGVVVAYWIGFTATRLLGGTPHVTPDIPALFLRKLVEALVVGAVVYALLRTTGERPRDLGIARESVPGSIGQGLLWAALLFVLINVVLNPLVGSLVGGDGVDSRTRELFRDRSQWPWWAATAIVGGGFAEELARAFALSRFRRLAGTAGLVVAVIADSIVFGIGHRYQGTAGAISAGITGVLFALLYLRRGRAVDAMAAHAAFDLYGIAAAYALFGRG